MQEVTIKPRQVFQYPVRVDLAGKQITWNFTTRGKNVSFGLFKRKQMTKEETVQFNPTSSQVQISQIQSNELSHLDSTDILMESNSPSSNSNGMIVSPSFGSSQYESNSKSPSVSQISSIKDDNRNTPRKERNLVV